jgi:hypothetical protein
MMRAINLQDHTPPVIERPLGVDIAEPSMRVHALDLPIRLLNPKATADSN